MSYWLGEWSVGRWLYWLGWGVAGGLFMLAVALMLPA